MWRPGAARVEPGEQRAELAVLARELRHHSGVGPVAWPARSAPCHQHITSRGRSRRGQIEPREDLRHLLGFADLRVERRHAIARADAAPVGLRAHPEEGRRGHALALGRGPERLGLDPARVVRVVEALAARAVPEPVVDDAVAVGRRAGGERDVARETCSTGTPGRVAPRAARRARSARTPGSSRGRDSRGARRRARARSRSAGRGPPAAGAAPARSHAQRSDHAASTAISAARFASRIPAAGRSNDQPRNVSRSSATSSARARTAALGSCSAISTRRRTRPGSSRPKRRARWPKLAIAPARTPGAAVARELHAAALRPLPGLPRDADLEREVGELGGVVALDRVLDAGAERRVAGVPSHRHDASRPAARRCESSRPNGNAQSGFTGSAR